jgi:glutathione S-transferase
MRVTTFYYSTNTCSLGIRVILEEIGLPYDAVGIDFKSREQFGPAYSQLNPKRKVPALVRPDGTLLTEFQAIAFWLARMRRLCPIELGYF